MTHFRYVGLVVAAAACMVLGASSAAEAQYNAGGSTAPDGIWAGGGPHASAGRFDAAGLRLEVGIPIDVVGPGLLSIAIPLATLHDGRGPFARANIVSVAPEIQWEYVFPIRMKHRFSISPYAGVGFGGYWVKYDQDDPFLPGGDGGTYGDFGMLVTTGAVLRFGFDFGLYLQMQPAAVSFNITFGDHIDDFFAMYEWYFGVGYRWD